MQLNDCIYASLGDQSYTGALNDRYLQWCLANGGTTPCLPDAEMEMLIAQGATVPQLNDAWHELLTARYGEGQLNDLKYQFFCTDGGAWGLIPTSGWTGPYGGCQFAQYLAADTFTDADNTQLVSHRPDAGGPWIATSPDGTAGAATHHTIVGNAALIHVDAKAAVIDTGEADVWIEVMYTVGSASKSGILFRNSADGNGLSFRVRPADNAMELISWPGPSTIGSSVPISWAQGEAKRLGVVANGTSIKCYVNGVEVIDETTTTYQTNTRHGITSYGSSNDETFDNFTVSTP